MWILILIACGPTCNTTTLDGQYTTIERCEEAVKAFTNDSTPFKIIRREAYCVPAPDDVVYE